MNDLVQAATIVGEAVALRAERDKLLDDVTEWTATNPYEAYGDRNDSLSAEQVQLLLEDPDKFREHWWEEVEHNCFLYADWSYLHDECIDHFRARLIAAYPGEVDESTAWGDLPDEIHEAFAEGECIDTSDLLDTCLRHASRTVNIVAIVSDPNSPDDDSDEPGAIRLPHCALSDEENEKRQRYLEETFGIDGWACESMYEHERLCIPGRLDLKHVYEHGVPETVTITPEHYMVFHTAWNGSGAMDTPHSKKTVTLPARFIVDEARKWGLDSVYGFTGAVWRHEL